MSLYNLIHGTNPIAPILLHALGNPDVPRFRDIYVDDDKIALYTRTGGGNRDYYECEERCRANYPEYFEGDEPPDGPWNADLRALTGYLYDEDDDFDSTYATFYFEIPAAFADMIRVLREIGAGREEKPADAWQRVLSDLQSGKNTPETERAMKGMAPVLEKISAFVQEPQQ